MWPLKSRNKTLSPVASPFAWNWVVKEPFSGAWQKNIEWKRDTVLSYHAIFACITLIASDISKLRFRFIRQEQSGIWIEVPFTKTVSVLKKPNPWQNRIQFVEAWMNSKLIRGNAYVLKQKNRKGDVVGLYVLCPDLVQPLVSDSGEVFYQLSPDRLSKLEESVVVPAEEMIHDRFNCLFHPLCGLSPLFASGLAGHQGLQIQKNSAFFFGNMSQPGGILTAPGHISDETAKRLKEGWEEGYSGKNAGKVAVLGDDLKYVPLAMTADESQMVEQMGMTSKIVCSTFHVPPYKVIDDAPSYNNIEALEQQYYSQCLQILIESIELCLNEGLSVADGTGIEMDLDGLLRMDTNTKVKTLKEGVTGGLYKPNEGRKRLNLAPVEGGDSVYLQQQNFSLEALARRDNSEDPFRSSSATATSPANDDQKTQTEEENMKDFALSFVKAMQDA